MFTLTFTFVYKNFIQRPGNTYPRGAKMDYFYALIAYCLFNLLLAILIVRLFPYSDISIRIRKNLAMMLLLPIFIVFHIVAKIINFIIFLFISAFEVLSGRKIYRRKYSYALNYYGSEEYRRNHRRAMETKPIEDNEPDETRAADDSKSGAK